MSKTAQITYGYSVTGDGLNASDSATVQNTAAAAPTSQTIAQASFAAVTVPAGVTGVRIVPPVTNTLTITVKGITGDTGMQISPNSPSCFNFTSVGSPAFGIAIGAGSGSCALLFEWA